MKNTLFRVVIYAASVWVSHKFADRYWVVGPVFGAAVLAFLWGRVKNKLPVAAAYFAASTAIYALVYHLSTLKWGNRSDLFEYVIGSFQVAVVAGSILLPAAHCLILGGDRKRAWRAAVALIGSFYLVTFLAYLDDKGAVNLNLPWLLTLVAVWQGIYLWIHDE